MDRGLVPRFRLAAWQGVLPQRTAKPAARCSPEGRRRHDPAPPQPPAPQGPAVHREELLEPAEALRTRTVAQHRHQQHHSGEEDLVSEEPHRGRRHPPPAPLHRAAEAEALGVLRAQPARPAPWLAPVARPVQCTAAPRATAGMGLLRQVPVDAKKKREKPGVGEQALVQGRRLLSGLTPKEDTPSGGHVNPLGGTPSPHPQPPPTPRALRARRMPSKQRPDHGLQGTTVPLPHPI